MYARARLGVVTHRHEFMVADLQEEFSLSFEQLQHGTIRAVDAHQPRATYQILL
jgi:hypothetical protein